MSKLEAFFNRPVGIFSWVLSKDPAACAKLATDYRFSCLQWGYHYECTDDEFTVATAVDSQKALSDAGIDVVALAGYQNIAAYDPEYKAKAIKRLELYIDLTEVFPKSVGIATETGTKNRESQWNGHPDNLKPESWDEMIASLHYLGAKAKAAGTKFLIEGYVENIVRHPGDLARIKQEVDMEAFGFVMDPYNLILEEKVPTLQDEIKEIFDVMDGHVGIAHAKDLLYKDGVISTPRSGQGMFDFQTFFKLLDERLPGIPLILEHLTVEEIPETLDYLKSQYEEYKNSCN